LGEEAAIAALFFFLQDFSKKVGISKRELDLQDEMEELR
jgi:hypothetical protein